MFFRLMFMLIWVAEKQSKVYFVYERRLLSVRRLKG
jgi:hypothetical protein